MGVGEGLPPDQVGDGVVGRVGQVAPPRRPPQPGHDLLGDRHDGHALGVDHLGAGVEHEDALLVDLPAVGADGQVVRGRAVEDDPPVAGVAQHEVAGRLDGGGRGGAVEPHCVVLVRRRHPRVAGADPALDRDEGRGPALGQAAVEQAGPGEPVGGPR